MAEAGADRRGRYPRAPRSKRAILSCGQEPVGDLPGRSDAAPVQLVSRQLRLRCAPQLRCAR